MNNEDDINNWLKQNLLELAKFHKERCQDPECNIQLSSIHEVLKRLDIPLTDEERLVLM